MGEFVFPGVAALAFACAAFRDLGWRRIDNGLILVAAAAWGLAAATTGFGPSTVSEAGSGSGVGVVADHLGTAGVTFLALLPFYARDWIGGGDVKMATIVLLWAGPGFALPALTITALGGMVLAGLMLGLRPWRSLSGRPGVGGRILAILDERQGVPYGVALAVAGLAAALHPVLPVARG